MDINIENYNDYRENPNATDENSIKTYGGFYIGRYEAEADRGGVWHDSASNWPAGARNCCNGSADHNVLFRLNLYLM